MNELKRRSADAARPYANILPIDDLLVAHGNRVIGGGFVLSQHGWRCQLDSSLDFDVIARTFVLPPTILVSPSTDSVLDQLSWCVIEGPGASASDPGRGSGRMRLFGSDVPHPRICPSTGTDHPKSEPAVPVEGHVRGRPGRCTH